MNTTDYGQELPQQQQQQPLSQHLLMHSTKAHRMASFGSPWMVVILVALGLSCLACVGLAYLLWLHKPSFIHFDSGVRLAASETGVEVQNDSGSTVSSLTTGGGVDVQSVTFPNGMTLSSSSSKLLLTHGTTTLASWDVDGTNTQMADTTQTTFQTLQFHNGLAIEAVDTGSSGAALRVTGNVEMEGDCTVSSGTLRVTGTSSQLLLDDGAKESWGDAGLVRSATSQGISTATTAGSTVQFASSSGVTTHVPATFQSTLEAQGALTVSAPLTVSSLTATSLNVPNAWSASAQNGVVVSAPWSADNTVTAKDAVVCDSTLAVGGTTTTKGALVAEDGVVVGTASPWKLEPITDGVGLRAMHQTAHVWSATSTTSSSSSSSSSEVTSKLTFLNPRADSWVLNNGTRIAANGSNALVVQDNTGGTLLTVNGDDQTTTMDNLAVSWGVDFSNSVVPMKGIAGPQTTAGTDGSAPTYGPLLVHSTLTPSASGAAIQLGGDVTFTESNSVLRVDHVQPRSGSSFTEMGAIGCTAPIAVTGSMYLIQPNGSSSQIKDEQRVLEWSIESWTGDVHMYPLQGGGVYFNAQNEGWKWWSDGSSTPPSWVSGLLSAEQASASET